MILKQSRRLAVLNQIEQILLTPKAVQKIKADLILNHLAIMAQIVVLPGSRGLNQMIMSIQDIATVPDTTPSPHKSTDDSNPKDTDKSDPKPHSARTSPNDDSSDATSSSHNEDNPNGSNGQAA